MAAAVSVPLSILIAVCLAVRRCRKRGRGHLGGKEGKRGKDWGVGNLLQGRDREGFKPLDTEERDGMLDDDSDSEVICTTRCFHFNLMPGGRVLNPCQPCLEKMYYVGICDIKLTRSSSSWKTVLEKSEWKNATRGRSIQPLVKQIHWVVYDESTKTMLFIYVVYLTVMIYLLVSKVQTLPFN